MTTSPAEPVPESEQPAAKPVTAATKPAAEAQSTSEAGPAAEAQPTPEAGPAAEAGPTPEAGPAAEAQPTPEAGPAAEAGPAPEAQPSAAAEKTTDIVPGPGGVMTDEVGVVTGDLTLRSELAGDRLTLRVQYKDADEWYVVTGGKATIKDPADLEAVHQIAVGLLNRPEG